MAALLDTFVVAQPYQPLQIIHYDGPPKPKQPSRRNPPKIPSRDDWPRSNAERGNKENLVLTMDEAEFVDLTFLADEEGSCEFSGSGGGESGVVDSDDVSSPVTEREGVSMPISKEDPGDEASHQPAPPEGSSQGNTVIIKDSQSESDYNEGDFHKDDAGSQIGDQLKTSSISTPDYRDRESPAGTTDGFIKKSIEREVGPPTFECTSSSSSSSSGSDADDNAHSGNHTSLARKRKRSPTTTRHIQMPITTSKPQTKHITHSARQRRSSTIRDRPNRPSTLEPISAAQSSSYRVDICYSDSSDDSSDNSSARHLTSNKRRMPTADPIHPHGQNREHYRKSTEDDEYEVEGILEARVNRRKLQYRVKWLGYKNDPQWYDAANFKNSPHRLRSFHAADPTRIGPPKRLETWVQCWEEDRDADDHPDDNKPERSYPRGRRLRGDQENVYATG